MAQLLKTPAAIHRRPLFSAFLWRLALAIFGPAERFEPYAVEPLTLTLRSLRQPLKSSNSNPKSSQNEAQNDIFEALEGLRRLLGQLLRARSLRMSSLDRP